MNEATFLSTLHENSADELTWLALADWLDDDGQPDRAELLRTARRLPALPVMKRTKARAALEERVIALLAAGARPVAPELTNSIGMRLALIPPGRFRMGSPSNERERGGDQKAREVCVERRFYLGVFPVTQAQYRAVTGDNPSWFRHGGSSNVDDVAEEELADFPVERVSWEDAEAFVGRLNARTRGEHPGLTYCLPTEAQWEYACRAGTSGPFHLGARLDSTKANFNGNHPYAGAPVGPYLDRTSKVGSYAPNAFGLYDMHGNVFEWCHLDEGAPGIQAIRGGAYMAWGFGCRSAYRYRWRAQAREAYNGFRVALADVEGAA